MSQDQNRKEIDRLLTSMAIYYDKDLPLVAIDIYHELWSEFNMDEIKAACTFHMKTCKFFPKASEICEIIKARRPNQSIEARALQEWRKVILAIRQRGEHRGPPQFKDKITNYLIATQFSWQRLCNMLVDKEEWEQKRWCESFELVDEETINQVLIEQNKELKKLTAPIGEIDGDN
jgi:hypothetical protein